MEKHENQQRSRINKAFEKIPRFDGTNPSYCFDWLEQTEALVNEHHRRIYREELLLNCGTSVSETIHALPQGATNQSIKDAVLRNHSNLRTVSQRSNAYHQLHQKPYEALQSYNTRYASFFNLALLSLGRAPTEADLGPQSPELCSSSLMPYDIEEDRDFDEMQEQQEGILEQMEVEGQDTTEAPIKRGMGISVAPKKYQPAPPKYIRAGENSEDEEDGQDEEEDLEAPYLAPKSALPSGPAQSEESAQIPVAGDQTPAKDLSDSESIPELIDLREEGEKPSPFPS